LRECDRRGERGLGGWGGRAAMNMKNL